MGVTYIADVKTNKRFEGNVVILMGGYYFAVRQPDTGLSIPSPRDKCVVSLTLNPTVIDVRRVTTSISSNTFKMIDKNNFITSLILGDAANLINQPVRIWLGRSNLTGNPSNNMDFGDYFELPVTYLKKPEHGENAYTFNSTEQTERLARTIYDFKSALAVDILAATTEWTMRDDISSFPTSGFLKVEDEFVSYSGIDLINNRFAGVIRGEYNSIPVDHDANSDCVLVEQVEDNPLNIILKILTSGGGGGTYDVLQDGLGISNTLIDISGIESLRDERFSDYTFRLKIYDVDNALTLIENELLAPNNLRFTTSLDSKLTIIELDKATFVEEENIIDEDSITKYPKWSIDGNKITNVIEIQWDYDHATNMFNERSVFEDAASISTYGRQTPLKFDFKAVVADLDGEFVVQEFGSRLLARLSTPTPEIQVITQMDKSLQNVGEKTQLTSNEIPAFDGSLVFDNLLEIISRAINYSNGDVTFKLAFTSFTNIRSAFIAPSDMVLDFIDQQNIYIETGRKDYYKVGWYMRLFDMDTMTYTADAPNMITAIGTGLIYLYDEDGYRIVDEDGDPILAEDSIDYDILTFEDSWSTTLIPGRHRVRFANYDEVSESQKRYGFISNAGLNFLSDNKPTYRITY